jgi:hypothetical protein
VRFLVQEDGKTKLYNHGFENPGYAGVILFHLAQLEDVYTIAGYVPPVHVLPNLPGLSAWLTQTMTSSAFEFVPSCETASSSTTYCDDRCLPSGGYRSPDQFPIRGLLQERGVEPGLFACSCQSYGDELEARGVRPDVVDASCSAFGSPLQSCVEMSPLPTLSRAIAAYYVAATLANGATYVPASGTVAGYGAFDCERAWETHECDPSISTSGVSLFDDVDANHWSCPFAHYLFAHGLTAGCSANPSFCPEGEVSRGMMAVFVAKAVVGSGQPVPASYTDPGTGRAYSCEVATADTHYADVPAGNIWCPAAHFLWARGLHEGCASTQFCPDTGVTRATIPPFLAALPQL